MQLADLGLAIDPAGECLVACDRATLTHSLSLSLSLSERERQRVSEGD
jgi:hypothetical protein